MASGIWQKLAFLAWFSEVFGPQLDCIATDLAHFRDMHSQRYPDGALKISFQMIRGARTSSTLNGQQTDGGTEPLTGPLQEER